MGSWCKFVLFHCDSFVIHIDMNKSGGENFLTGCSAALRSVFLFQMLGTDATCFGSEISTVDPNQKTLELKTTNVRWPLFICCVHYKTR